MYTVYTVYCTINDLTPTICLAAWEPPGKQPLLLISIKFTPKNSNPVALKKSTFLSHSIRVWYIYLHLPYFTIKNNQM